MYMRELLLGGYAGEVLSINVSGFRVGHSQLPSNRSWQTDASFGANTLTIAFGQRSGGDGVVVHAPTTWSSARVTLAHHRFSNSAGMVWRPLCLGLAVCPSN